MQYRSFGTTGKRVSALGFGAMRLPTKGDQDDVDAAAAVEMIRYAVDNGVNYVDTAYPYHAGKSEWVVGSALDDGYREKVFLATKLPSWKIEKPEDCDRFFNEQLSRLRTDYVDFYLLHCLQERSWAKLKGLGVLEWAERLQAEGRIGEFGFSFHDSYEVFKQIVDDYAWSFCQIQYNFVNEDVQAGTRGLNYAAEKGLAVVVMEPLFGGTLADPPQEVWDIWNSTQIKSRPADLALRWLWNKPEVSLVLSGMSTIEHVKQNIESASRSGVGRLDEEEAALIRMVQEKYKDLSPIPCSKCGYCMPCPNGVNIPLNFELYNNAVVFKGNSTVLCRNLYTSLLETERAEACGQCEACDEKCPQDIEISQTMKRVAQELGKRHASKSVD